MSNVSTDFISLPGLTSSSIMTSPTPASAGLKNRSQSLMVKVRRGTLFRPRGRTESFDLVEQRTAASATAAFNNKGQDFMINNDNRDSSPKKKSCLKLKMTKNKGKAKGKVNSDTSTEKNIKNPTIRTVSFDARAASLAIPHPESNPLLNKEAADGSTQRFQITKTRHYIRKFVKLTGHTYACINLTFFKYAAHSITGNGLKLIWKKFVKSLQVNFWRVLVILNHLKQRCWCC